MRRDPSPIRLVRRASTVLFAVIVGVLAATPLVAQSYRARMSREIADRLAHRVEASSEIIVSSTSGDFDGLAARYGAQLKRRIQGGAVLVATGGQIDARTQ